MVAKVLGCCHASVVTACTANGYNKLAFTLLFTKEVIVMTDFEMLSLVIMIIMLVFAALSYCKNDK